MLQKCTVSQSLWDTVLKLQNDICLEKFVLGGGTGISLQIGHRMSDDIDMFSNEPMENTKIVNRMTALYGNNFEIFNNEDSVLQYSLDGIKIDLVSFKYNLIENIKIEDDIKMFGLKDLAAMKLAAVGSGIRHKGKDYVDLVYLLKHFPLGDMFEYYKKKYDKDDISFIKKRLCEGKTVNPYEWSTLKMLDKSIFLSDVPDMLTEEVNKYNKGHELITKKKWFG
jgi:hypothetical protein